MFTLTDSEVEVKVVPEYAPEGLLYRLESSFLGFDVNSKVLYTDLSKAVSDARVAFYLLNGLSQLTGAK